MYTLRNMRALRPNSAFLPVAPASTTFLRPLSPTSPDHHRHLSTRPATPRHNLGRPGSGRVITTASVDLKFIRDNAALVRQNVADRAVSADVDAVVSLYDDLVSLSLRADRVRTARNENAARMKGAGKMSKEERDGVIAEGKQLKVQLADLEAQLGTLEQTLSTEAAKIPNMTHPDSPRGSEENASILHTHGTKPDFAAAGFTPATHVDLATRHDLIDFENAARVAGNKFYYLRNEGALLELALISWAMSRARAHGFTIMTTPDVARENVVAGCGFQPRGESSQVYRLHDSDLCLVGTAEIALGGYFADQIVDRERLPIKMAAFSHCFRREVGAAGATTKGLYRVHQFSKVEMFVIAHPDESDKLLEELRALEEDMYSSLGLHFKTLDMPTQDLGNPAYRKYDIEAWMPGRDSYGEISSASNCTDYQARRLGIRYRQARGNNRYVHTLNATACAVPRMVIALLETHQRADGSIAIPKPLQPFMGGLEVIGESENEGTGSVPMRPAETVRTA